MSSPPEVPSGGRSSCRRAVPVRGASGCRGRGDVFVNMQTDFRAQLSRCQKLVLPLLGGGEGVPSELRIHGLGLAIPRAINIALQLEAASGGALRLDASTSTVPLPDGADPDADPDGADAAPGRPRHNSAIHIRLRRARGPPC